MRASSYAVTMEVGAYRHAAELACVTGAKTESWYVEVGAMLSMLQRAVDGEVDAGAIRDELRRAISPPSGCCSDCDAAARHYPVARRRHAERIRQWDQEQQLLSGEDRYLMNKGKIHRWDCKRPPQPAPPRFPADLHAFAVLFSHYDESLDSVFQALDSQPSRNTRRVSQADIFAMTVRDGPSAIRKKLCRICRPQLPALTPSDLLAQPSCWSWPASPAILDQLAAPAATKPRIQEHILPDQQAAFAILEHWHASRCAICGQSPAAGAAGLVRDHDHASGLIRGLLCSACNTAEGRSDSWLFSSYRQRPPSAILRLSVLYLPQDFRPGAAHMAQRQ